MSGFEIHCQRCESPLEKEDLRCPICSHAASSTAPEDLASAEVEVLRCEGCGAAVSYDVSARAPSCAFCASTMVVEVPSDPLEQTEFFLPFTVDPSAAESAFRRWLGGLGWFRPSKLGSRSTIEQLRPLWWVAWVFDADAIVSWAADSDAGSRRSDWAPHAGRAILEFDDVAVSASRGLSAEETAFLGASYELSSAFDEPSGAEGQAATEQFDLPRSAARKRVAEMIEHTAKVRLEDGYIPGRRFRNLHTEVLLRRLVTRRYAFPSFVLAYRYRGALYRVVLSGQDSDRILGDAPYSVAKILFTVTASVLAIGALAAMLL